MSSGLIFNPTQNPELSIIENGFWPDIDLNDFRAQMRVGGQIIPAIRMENAIIAAIITVENSIIDRMAQWQLEGHQTLGAVPAPIFAGQSKFVQIWRRAVYCYANAELIETNNDISATQDGFSRSNETQGAAHELRVLALSAVSDLLQTPRVFIGGC